MLRVRLISYLQFVWGSGFSGFNVAFVSFWLLWLPEAAWLTSATLAMPAADPAPVGTGSLYWSLLDSAAILAVYGLIFAVVYQLLFFIVRFFAAIISHGQYLMGRIAPGLAVFCLVGEPVLQFAGLHLATPDPQAGLFWALAPPALLVSLGAGALLLYVAPVFRGYNASFLLAAAVAARVVMFPVAPVPDSATGFLIHELTLLLTAFFIFITLQIRYRLHLWPNYEAVEVPDRFVQIGAIITLFCAALYVIVELPAFNMLNNNKNGSPYFIPTACWFVCAVQWTITAFILERGRSVSLHQQKEQIQAAVLRSLSIAIGVLLAVLFAVTGFPQPGLDRLTARHSTSGELLYFTGMLLDGDRDGNSLWPGRDPDDQDPCVRADLRASCAGPERSASNEPTQPAVTVLYGAPDNAPRNATIGDRNVLLLTWVTRAPQFPEETEAIPLYFGSNRPEHSLQAMLRNTDGIGRSLDDSGTNNALNAVDATSALPSELARRGYRTICTGRTTRPTVSEDYFRTGHATHLDAGCQVFQPLDAFIESPDHSSATDVHSRRSNINQTVLEGLFVFDRYREEHANFLWIHYEGPTTRRDLRTNGSPGDAKLERETLHRMRQVGDVIVIQMRPDDVFGNAYLFAGGRPRELPEYPRPGELIRFALGMRTTAPGSARNQIAALYQESFSESWWLKSARRLGWRYPELPVYTLRLDAAGMPVVFNGLTGLSTNQSDTRE